MVKEIEEVLIFVRDEDRDRCKKIVDAEIEKNGQENLRQLREVIVEDILRITYSKSGGFSESTLESFVKVYFQSELYSEYI